jgi:hypothetical protein
MAGEIAVQPVAQESGRNSYAIACTFRLRLLDAATGQPVTDACAVKPTVDQAVLNQRGTHPLRVLGERNVGFKGTGIDDFEFGVRNLRTWTPAASSTATQPRLQATWTCTREIIHPHESGAVLASGDGSSLFMRVEGSPERYVCARAAGTTYAQRDLVSDRRGVLEIPVTFRQWVSGVSLTVKLRDYVILPAQGSFAPENLTASETAAGTAASPNGHAALTITLAGDPAGNDWRATAGGGERKFDDEHVFAMPPLARAVIDATAWAVRRVRNATALVAGAVLPGAAAGGCTRQGLMIHYNSGYFLSEKRGAVTRLCREAFTSGENDFMMLPHVALWILKRLNGAGGHLGYHYHLDRDGAICISLADSARIHHAGHSREPNAVSARENVVLNQRTVSHDFAAPRANLNNHYVGVDLLGHHVAGFGYTGHQHWYLDRLIENIRSRCPGVQWHNILGHDEVRAAYRTHVDSTKPAKEDPGAALRGGAQGMELLRGRHGATFPPPAPAS